MKNRLATLLVLARVLVGCGGKKKKPEPRELKTDPETDKMFADALERMKDKTPTVELTIAAAKRLRELMKQENQAYVRLSIQNYGEETGMSYDLRLDNRFNSDQDVINKWHDVEVLIDKRSAAMVRGTKIDYRGMKNGKDDFVFDNPNEKKQDNQTKN